jgi:hypothetical protein
VGPEETIHEGIPGLGGGQKWRVNEAQNPRKFNAILDEKEMEIAYKPNPSPKSSEKLGYGFTRTSFMMRPETFQS